MPIQTPHPLYRQYKPRWKRARDAVEGEDAVKGATTEYLPKLEDQKDSEYAGYITRASYYNATGRTVTGMSGLVNRKPPKFDLPDAIKPLEERATEKGQTLPEVGKEATHVLLASGRLGILVDRPERDNEPPYLVVYAAEEITNWRETEDGTLTLVVLAEGYYEPDPEDPYTVYARIRYRELYLTTELDERGNEVVADGAIYQQRVWESDNPNTAQITTASETYKVVEEITPLANGAPLDHIPFVFVNPAGIGTEVWNPPILDIANVNLSHYRNSADIEHGRHLSALPTPWVSGVDASDTGPKLPLGSGKAWRLPEGANVGFLEMQNQSMQALKEGMEEKENKMSALGARMIEPPRRGVEAAETARIHQAGTTATLADVADAVGRGLEQALREAAMWEGMTEEAAKDAVSLEMNKDFVDSKLTSQELTALVDAYLKGGITMETLTYNLKAGEVLPEDQSIEDEMALLEARNPNASTDGGAGEIAATQGGRTYELERGEGGNVFRIRATP